MRTDLRRSKRCNEFIAVSVLARNKTNDVREAGSCTGRIINIPRPGACILMPVGVNPFVLDDLHAFRMGVEFTTETTVSESDGVIRDLRAARHGDMPEVVR